MARFGELEFINMTNQSAEEKRERISKIRAVMMKNSHRERRLAKENNGHNKTPPKASTTPSSPSSPPPRSKSRASSSQAVSRDVNRDSAKARSSPPCDSHVGVDYPDPEPFPHGFAPETNYGLPLDTLNRASIVRPTPELLEGLGLWLSTNLKVVGDRDRISDCYLGYCREGTISSSIIISSILFTILIYGDISNNRALGQAATRQYSQTITLLNKALAQPATATHSATISSIFGMMSHQFIMGCSLDDFDMHEQGVQKIIQLRGGLGDTLQDNINRTALTLMKALRRLSLVTFRKSHGSSHTFHSNQASNFNEWFSLSYHHFTLRTLKGVNGFLRQDSRLIDTLSNLHELVELAQILDSNAQEPHCSDIGGRWENSKWRAVYGREYALQQDVAPKHSAESHKLEACRTASIIFASAADPDILFLSPSMALETWNPDNYLADLVLSLRYSISASNPTDFWAPLPGALLWCLVIGTVASTRLGEAFATTRAWFRMELLKVCVAYWYTAGQPAQTVVESFDMVTQGVQAAMNLKSACHAAGSPNATCQAHIQGPASPSSWAERPRLMIDQF